MQYARFFRDESRYLAEWIKFHCLVGVDHFYLYDNGSIDRPELTLAPYISSGLVTLKAWPIPFHLHAARRAYADCLEDVRGKARWLACLDIDEFLFSPQYQILKEALPHYEQFPGIVVRWQVYGSSGLKKMSDEPVISRFTHRAPINWVRNRRVKSIVDPSRALGPAGCHHFVYKNDTQAVDERKHPVKIKPGFAYKRVMRPFYRILGSAVKYTDPYARKDINNKVISVDRLRINHYPIKSREEYMNKSRYKKEKRRYEGVDYFSYHDRNEVYDPVLHRYLPKLHSDMKRFKE